MSKGPKSRRRKKHEQRWIIIFEVPGEDDATTMLSKGDYSSALQARKSLVFSPMASDARWLLNLENGDTEVP